MQRKTARHEALKIVIKCQRIQTKLDKPDTHKYVTRNTITNILQKH